MKNKKMLVDKLELLTPKEDQRGRGPGFIWTLKEVDHTQYGGVFFFRYVDIYLLSDIYQYPYTKRDDEHWQHYHMESPSE